MKLSQFNSALPYSGNFVLHNAFSDHFIVVNPLLLDLLKAAEATGDVLSLKSRHPTFFDELAAKGFIVEDRLDEVEEVRKLATDIDRSTSSYHLTVNPTMGCNFKCWYCYETHIAGSRMQESTINSILRLIQNIKNDNLQHFSLSFFGGEPLLCYAHVVAPLLSGARRIFEGSNIAFQASITTNGFLIDQAKIDFFKSHSLLSFQITLDGNEQFHNRTRFVSAAKGSYREIVNNIKLLARNELNVIMRINFTQANHLSCADIANDFVDLEEKYKKHLTVDFHQVWQDDVSMEPNELGPVLDSFSRAGLEVSVEAKALNNVLNSCYADKDNSSTINFDGEVFKCTARDFSKQNSLGVLQHDGTIRWNPEYERRQDAKFQNPPCLKCRLLPICNGGCSQHAYENLGSDKGYCVFGFDEHRKDLLLIERFRLRIAQ